MKATTSLIGRSIIIAIAFGSVGLLSNLAAEFPLSWVYSPPAKVTLAGVAVDLIDEKQAARFIDDPNTVFIDSRKCNDYVELHVKGAICLPPDNVEERFPSVEAFIMPDTRLILYCYGPDCDMAERVGSFLAQLGHKNMMIMSSGFSAWRKARFPVDGKSNSDTSKEHLQDFWNQYDLADQELVHVQFCICLSRSIRQDFS